MPEVTKCRGGSYSGSSVLELPVYDPLALLIRARGEEAHWDTELTAHSLGTK